MGEVYLCADGEIRRLDTVNDEFLRYSMPINEKDGKYTWSKLPSTRRNLIESDFINGKILVK